MGIEKEAEAWRKAVDVARGLPKVTEPAIVLAADTVVIGRGLLLGKPGTAEEAARMLGIGERTLYRKIKKWDLEAHSTTGP